MHPVQPKLSKNPVMHAARVCVPCYGLCSHNLFADGQRIWAARANAIRIVGAHRRKERDHLRHRA